MKSYKKSVPCENCGLEFIKRFNYDETKNSKYHYCSKECHKAKQTVKWTDERKAKYIKDFSGENNSNYGNKWTDEQKEIASIIKKKQFDNNPNYAYECGKTNRGKVMTEAEIKNWHKNNKPIKHSEQRKIEIGKKSAEKFTEEFKIKYRKTMEERGFWIPLEEKSEYEKYYKDSNWIANMIEYFSDDELILLEEFGIFNSVKNSKGYVRDHIVPRVIGFEYKIPPELLRHPANCKFISHASNITKGFVDKIKSDEDIRKSIIDLYSRIVNFTKEWQEQDKCLQILKRINYECIYSVRSSHQP